MAAPSDSDLRMLRAIITLAERRGEPPTMAELAEAIGLGRNARGNVHRQLSRLRPEYVTWDQHGPRSLSVTDKGRDALRNETAARPHRELAPSSLLSIIASGITHLAERIAADLPRQPLFPDSLQRGVNRLAVHCLLHRATPPQDVEDVLAWARRPLRDWPIQFDDLAEDMYGVPLIDEAQRPSDLCVELAEIVKGNAEHEACLKMLTTLVYNSRILGDSELQELYVAVRRFLIEHPVISEFDLIRAVNRPPLTAVGGDLHDLYEPIPETHLLDGQPHCCGYCGWPLERRDDGWRCASPFCAVMTDSFTKGTLIFPRPEYGPLLRVRRPVRTYVVAPGKPELDLYTKLTKLGIPVDLWPGGDRYDLRVHINDQQRWAIDVKDWTYAHTLARHMAPFALTDADDPAITRAFYVIPDARATASYLAYLKNAAATKPFQVLTLRQIIDAARKARTEGAHA